MLVYSVPNAFVTEQYGLFPLLYSIYWLVHLNRIFYMVKSHIVVFTNNLIWSGCLTFWLFDLLRDLFTPALCAMPVVNSAVSVFLQILD